MTTLAEFMKLSGGDNRPPMLDKDMYDSWQKNGMTMTKKYVELSARERIQADCDVKETNIILQGLTPDVYALINHHRIAKDLWKRIYLLMQGTSLTKHERECKLSDEFDKFAHIKRESLHQYYLRDLLTTNFDQLHAYLEQHELHANEVRLMLHQNGYPQPQTIPQIEYVNPSVNHQFQQAEFPQLDFGLATPMFKPGDDPIDAINKMMSFLSTVITSRLWRQSSFAAGTSGTRANISGKGGSSSGQQRIVKCFNCQREVLNEEELAFLADPRVAEAKAVFIANLSSYGSNVLSEVTNCNKVNKDNLIANESLSVELERYKERVKLLEERQHVILLEERQNVDLSAREKLIMDDIIRDKNAQFVDFEKEINSLKQTLSKQINEKESLTTTFNVLKNESKEKEANNIDKEIALEKKVKELDNIVYKMALAFQNPFYHKKAQQIRPMLYDGSVIAKETNVILIADLKETLMLEEESRSKMLLIQNQLQVKEMTIKKLKAHIKRVTKTSTSDSVKKDIDEIETINIELEHRVAKLISENEHLKQTYKQLYDSIKPSRGKVFVVTTLKNKLRKLKGKAIIDNVVSKHIVSTLVPGMFKIYLEPLAPKLLNNREAHSEYLKYTQEHVAFLWEIVEQGRSLNLINNSLEYACNTKNHRISRPPSSKEKNNVEVQSRKVRSSLNKKNSYSKNVCNEHVKLFVKHSVKGVEAICSICNECLSDANHDICLIDYVNNMNVRAKPTSKKIKKRKEWKPTRKVFNSVGYKWRPTGRNLTIDGNTSPLTRLTSTKVMPPKEPIQLEIVAQKPIVTRVYTRRPNVPKSVPDSKPKIVFQIVLWYLDSGCSKDMTGDRSQLTNFVHKFLSTVKFDLEVAFRKHTCFVRNLEGVDLLSGSQETNLYTLLIGDMMASSPICLLSKALKTKSWLWHR
ncbi:hypothetical protein Tco_1547382 [Tanacetum coccineum]